MTTRTASERPGKLRSSASQGPQTRAPQQRHFAFGAPALATLCFASELLSSGCQIAPHDMPRLGGGSKTDSAALHEPTARSIEGATTFTFLTYNVAGLPEGISASRPSRNIPRISPLLNGFDIVVAQEDFFYHDYLAASARHPFVASPSSFSLPRIGDGLSCFSQWPFHEMQHTPWAQCYGTLSDANDCLAAKGFAWGHHELSTGVGIDVYNLHMDAGSSDGDRKARFAQLIQLEDAISVRSQGRAVIVGGDTNLRGSEEEVPYTAMLGRLGLEDACQKLGCEQPSCIDRVAYRSGEPLTLEATHWAAPSIFNDEAGVGYSDHDAVAVTFSFQVNQPKQVAGPTAAQKHASNQR